MLQILVLSITKKQQINQNSISLGKYDRKTET